MSVIMNITFYYCKLYSIRVEAVALVLPSCKQSLSSGYSSLSFLHEIFRKREREREKIDCLNWSLHASALSIITIVGGGGNYLSFNSIFSLLSYPNNKVQICPLPNLDSNHKVSNILMKNLQSLTKQILLGDISLHKTPPPPMDKSVYTDSLHTRK